jgi:hypothetical protein
MATPVLQNGIFLRDTNYKVQGGNIDSYHMMNILKDTTPDDMGPVDLWAMVQKVEMPIYQLSSFGGKNVKKISDRLGRFRWQLPIVQELPYIVYDPQSANTKKGIDGQTFQIALNKRAFGHGALITYDKYNGAEMYVTSEPIIQVGDAWIYTVRLVNNSSAVFPTGMYLDNKYLTVGTRIFSAGSTMGEYGTRYDDLGEIRGGYREFYNFVGQSDAHASFEISGKADLMAKNGMNAKGDVVVTEIWKWLDWGADPSITNIDKMIEKYGMSWAQKQLKDGRLTRTFVTAIEAKCLAKIAHDIEYQLMWGKGGRISGTDGADDIRLTTGLWKQLDNNYKRIYNFGNFTLDLFKAELFNFFNGKVEFKGPDPQRKLIVQTGMGGMKLVNEAIKEYAVNSGLVINASEIGAITSNAKGAGRIEAMNLDFGFSYTSFTIPFLANVQFVLNPAFDNVHNNDIENPKINGFNLASYSFLIFDITDNTNDNIFLLEKEWDNQLRWWYVNGNMDYMGRTSGFQSAGGDFGYKVFMRQPHKGIWVKDPTKVLKIVMKNPITGGSL